MCHDSSSRRHVFSGSTEGLDVLGVHPVTIVREQLVRNRPYTKPEIFPREYRARNN